MRRGRRKKKTAAPADREALLQSARETQEKRANTYRAKALKLFPHVCGRCGISFNENNLHRLTVHHKDDNHHNNPPDGSNWELLCRSCHDVAHGEVPDHLKLGQDPLQREAESGLGFQAFEGLKDRLKEDE